MEMHIWMVSLDGIDEVLGAKKSLKEKYWRAKCIEGGNFGKGCSSRRSHSTEGSA